jgi:hypothetical protein
MENDHTSPGQILDSTSANVPQYDQQTFDDFFDELVRVPSEEPELQGPATCAKCGGPRPQGLLCLDCQMDALVEENRRQPRHHIIGVGYGTTYSGIAVSQPELAPQLNSDSIIWHRPWSADDAPREQRLELDQAVLPNPADAPRGGNFIFDLNMRPIEEPQPKRKRPSPDEAAEIAQKRGLACEYHRRRKRKVSCLVVAEELALTIG